MLECVHSNVWLTYHQGLSRWKV